LCHIIGKKILLLKGADDMNTQVLTVSSKGQISLPVALRKLLSIDAGDKLVAYASGDVIMLKPLKLPTAEEFEASLDEAQKWAASVGYKESDVNDIIKSVRENNRKR
jgi:AbrB family looped-hinge helix DNA binding protein